MDYPAPRVEIKNGKLDLSNAYATGIGSSTSSPSKFAYAQFPPGAERGGGARRRSSKRASPTACSTSRTTTRGRANAAHPLASLWDNGSDPVATLRARNGGAPHRPVDSSASGTFPIGTPLSELERKLLPLYLHHRYQLQAAVKSLGGVYFTYAVRTAGGPNPVEGCRRSSVRRRQRAALDAVLLDTVDR